MVDDIDHWLTQVICKPPGSWHARIMGVVALLELDQDRLLRLNALCLHHLRQGQAGPARCLFKTLRDQLEHRLNLEQTKVLEDYSRERPEWGQKLCAGQASLRRLLDHVGIELCQSDPAGALPGLECLDNTLRIYFASQREHLYPYLEELETLRRLVLDQLE